MSITKSDLVNQLNQKLGLPKKESIMIVETFFQEISEALARGEAVSYTHLRAHETMSNLV